MRMIAITLAAAAVGSAALAQGRLGNLGAGLAGLLGDGLDSATPVATDALAPIVADLIRNFRDDAIERGVAPIPDAIRQSLSDAVPAAVLDEVRWRVDGEAGLVNRGLFLLSSAFAVTLDHVILFASADEAADAGLWAHEIYHVMQYREWGIDGFATRYVADHDAVEHDAKEFQYAWWLANRAHDGTRPAGGIEHAR
jgi:Domain of unknown function (DUF4157)